MQVPPARSYRIPLVQCLSLVLWRSILNEGEGLLHGRVSILETLLNMNAATAQAIASESIATGSW